MTHRERICLIDRRDAALSITRQADLLDISRASIYYQPAVNQEDVRIMNLIDEIYTRYPFYGSRRIKAELKKYHDKDVNRKKIQRLMRIMGIETIYPKKHTSIPNLENKIYPYLLSGLTIEHPDQVWGTDITYIRLNQGFCYLVAIMDWFSRYVLSWQLSNNLDIDFALANLKQALKINCPLIHNSDQGSHFTSGQYTDILKESKIKISMDSRGRCLDNIFTERLWRSVKCENVYIKSYENAREARLGLEEYFDFYNNHRLHSGLNGHTPNEIYFKKILKH